MTGVPGRWWRRFLHPSRTALQAWLEGGNERIDDHVAGCNRCATRLEELEAASPAGLSEMLAMVYRAPADLSERLERRVVERLDARVMFGLVADLFGAGLETSKLLFLEETREGTTDE